MFDLDREDCEEWLEGLLALQSTGTAVVLKVEPEGTDSQGARSLPTTVQISLGATDEIEFSRDILAWTVDGETLEGMMAGLRRAIDDGWFTPAEIGTVDGPRGKVWWLYWQRRRANEGARP